MAGRVNTTSTASTKPDRRRWRLGILCVGLICGLVGCGGKSAAPHAPSSVSNIQSLVKGELGVFFAPGHRVPPPGPFQQALLEKKHLTFADYQSAMQAAADCIEQRVPGASVQLRPQPGWTQIYYFVTASGGGATGSLAQGNAPSGSRASSTPTTATRTGTTPTTSQPSAPVAPPPAEIAAQSAEGYCVATYSAHVEARWRLMQVLSGPQLSAQRTLFLKCMEAAGITVPADASNDKLGQIFNDPSTYAKLNPEQMQQSNSCTTRFQRFLFSISPP